MHKHLHSERRYVLAHRRAFDPFALLHRSITPTCYEEDEFERRSHVARLWGISRTMYELRENLDDCTTFLDTLHRYIESASEPSRTNRRASITDPEPIKLKATAVHAILGKVATICLSKKPVNERVDATGSFWWTTVDAVELLHLLSKSTRERLPKVLSARLIGSEVPANGTLMSENELKDLQMKLDKRGKTSRQQTL